MRNEILLSHNGWLRLRIFLLQQSAPISPSVCMCVALQRYNWSAHDPDGEPPIMIT